MLKYLPAVLRWKDVTEEIQSQTGQDKPFYLRQRFWGLTGIAGSVTLSSALGIEVDRAAVNQAIDAMNTLSQALNQIYLIVKDNVIPSIMAVYFSYGVIKGQYDAKVRKVKNAAMDRPAQ